MLEKHMPRNHQRRQSRLLLGKLKVNDFGKIRTKFSMDDSQSNEVMSTSVDMPRGTDESCSEVIRESGENFWYKYILLVPDLSRSKNGCI